MSDYKQPLYYPNSSRGARGRSGKPRDGVWGSCRDIQLSKSLSWLLRHGAAHAGVQIDDEGFIPVDVVLNLQQFRSYNTDDVKRVVATNEKQRFALRDSGGSLQICANQGHTQKVENLNLTPITSPAQAPVVMHGTSLAAWETIRTQGLSRMARTHIHFAAGEPGTVKSGARLSSQVFIYMNLSAALSDGLEFFRSANDVILSPGDVSGVISTRYFSDVVDRNSGANLDF